MSTITGYIYYFAKGDTLHVPSGYLDIVSCDISGDSKYGDMSARKCVCLCVRACFIVCTYASVHKCTQVHVPVCLSVWMYVCLCVRAVVCAYVRVCTYANVHKWVKEPIHLSVCLSACLYVCMYVCMDGWMDGWMDACMLVCLFVCLFVCVHMLACVWARRYPCVCLPLVCLYVRMRAHAYVRVCVRVFVCVRA